MDAGGGVGLGVGVYAEIVSGILTSKVFLSVCYSI